MKAITYAAYGAPEVLNLQEVDKPIPNAKEILVRIHASAVNSADWRLRKGDPFAVRLFFGLTKPKKSILGGVLSGTVEAVGKDVTRFKVNDQVFGSTGMRFGAYAEYGCFPEDGILSIKPDNISHEQASIVPFGATTAMHFIRKAVIKKGQKVLVYGASGAVGTALVQLAKYFGAEVTGVCSTTNIDLVKSIGADKVIDYTKEDLTKNGLTYDVIFETVNKLPLSNLLPALKSNGLLIASAADFSQMLQSVWISMTHRKKIIVGVTNEKTEDICFLKTLIEQGRYKPVIDRIYPFEQMVDAHHYVEQGHKKGNVAVRIIGKVN